ncbi:MAG: 5-histidylcysteine sulfoxide synthase [Campylobacterales bacterium]|nr:5-histidylcysteine sulfoxide synthase [Campylobacterales bacterium]
MVRQMRSVRLDGADVDAKRCELRDYFHQSFELFESLFELLASDEVFYRQSEPTRHPMIFYFGHTAVFYINKLIIAGALSERINPGYESLFAVGVDEMVWDESSERFAWPKVDEVREYRKEVRNVVDRLIRTLPMKLPITQDDPFWAIWMGIEHERIHIETSSVLHRQMPLEFIRPGKAFPRCMSSGGTPENALFPIEGKRMTLGKGSDDRGLYGWDNEYGVCAYDVEDFKASTYLVSNGEFLPFVNDGGYRNPQWWDEEGQKFLQIRQPACPPFWVPQPDGTYRFRTLAEEIPLPMNWPVEVNALEAQAFCRWKSVHENAFYRLPSEAEWYLMVRECGMDAEIYDDTRTNLNLAHFASSVPVDTFAHGGLYDVVGNVWQWTQTPIDGFEGFSTHPWYDDFSTPTFDGKHNLLKGGSWISTGNEIVASSRYAFRRHFVQHAGFRYVVGGEPREQVRNQLIEDIEIAELCMAGYGEGNTFAQEAARSIREFIGKNDRVLELGCQAGRLSLELSEYCGTVTGVERSARFISPAVELLREGRFAFRYGGSVHEVYLEELNLPHSRERVVFYQGDMCNLKPHFRGYECIVINAAEEAVEEVPVIAETMKERLNPGGRVIALTPQPLTEGAKAFDYLCRSQPCRGFVNVWR